MAIYHLHLSSGNKERNLLAGSRLSYLRRSGKFATMDRVEGSVVRKVDRRTECLGEESGYLPAWSERDAAIFWEAADRYERANGSTYREVEVALPEELSLEEQWSLARRFAEYVARVPEGVTPYTFVLHQQDEEHSQRRHMHLMVSDRVHDDIGRGPELFFRRYRRKIPALGGCRKTEFRRAKGKHGSWAEQIRPLWEALANRELSRYGIRIDHRSLLAQGIDRPAQPKRGKVLQHGGAVVAPERATMWEQYRESLSWYQLGREVQAQADELDRRIHVLEQRRELRDEGVIRQRWAERRRKRLERWIAGMRYLAEAMYRDRSILEDLLDDRPVVVPGFASSWDPAWLDDIGFLGCAALWSHGRRGRSIFEDVKTWDYPDVALQMYQEGKEAYWSAIRKDLREQRAGQRPTGEPFLWKWVRAWLGSGLVQALGGLHRDRVRQRWAERRMRNRLRQALRQQRSDHVRGLLAPMPWVMGWMWICRQIVVCGQGQREEIRRLWEDRRHARREMEDRVFRESCRQLRTYLSQPVWHGDTQEGERVLQEFAVRSTTLGEQLYCRRYPNREDAVLESLREAFLRRSMALEEWRIVLLKLEGFTERLRSSPLGVLPEVYRQELEEMLPEVDWNSSCPEEAEEAVRTAHQEYTQYRRGHLIETLEDLGQVLSDRQWRESDEEVLRGSGVIWEADGRIGIPEILEDEESEAALEAFLIGVETGEVLTAIRAGHRGEADWEDRLLQVGCSLGQDGSWRVPEELEDCGAIPQNLAYLNQLIRQREDALWCAVSVLGEVIDTGWTQEHEQRLGERGIRGGPWKEWLCASEVDTADLREFLQKISVASVFAERLLQERKGLESFPEYRDIREEWGEERWESLGFVPNNTISGWRHATNPKLGKALVEAWWEAVWRRKVWEKSHSPGVPSPFRKGPAPGR